MSVQKSNLSIYIGTDFEAQYAVKSNNVSVSLIGSNISAKIKKYSGSIESITFNSIILPQVTGEFKIYLNASETEQIKPGKYMYDIFVIDASNIKTKLVEGYVFVKPLISK